MMQHSLFHGSLPLFAILSRLHAVCRPTLSALRSLSMACVHGFLGGQGGRLQWLGTAWFHQLKKAHK